MHTPFESLFETERFDEQTRSQYSLDALYDREKGTPLLELYNYWACLPVGAHGLPTLATCRPTTNLPHKVSDQLSWIGTSAENPMDYIMHNHVETHIPGFGVELSGMAFGEISVARLHVTACAIEYLTCKHERMAMYHEIDQILCGYKRHYTRVMVPVDNAAGTVIRVYFAVRLVQETRLVEARFGGEA